LFFFSLFKMMMFLTEIGTDRTGGSLPLLSNHAYPADHHDHVVAPPGRAMMMMLEVVIGWSIPSWRSTARGRAVGVSVRRAKTRVRVRVRVYYVWVPPRTG